MDGNTLGYFTLDFSGGHCAAFTNADIVRSRARLEADQLAL
jgi:hypothetical protein